MYAYDYENGWIIHDRTGYHPGDEVSKATVFALANGYLGVRGAPESLSPLLPGLVGTSINGLYDSPTGGILDREMINLPAWTGMALAVDGETLTVENAREYVRSLDLLQGILRQTCRWRTSRGLDISLNSERIVSLARLHLAAVHWELTASAACDLVLSSSIDADVNNRFASTHFADVRVESGGAVHITTIQQHYRVCVMADHDLSIPAEWISEATGRRLTHVGRLRLLPDQPVMLTKWVSIYDSRFSPDADLRDRCRADLDAARTAGYDAVCREHAGEWGRRWADSDVVIDGDERAQIAIRFCLFHLLANSPHSETVSISARGLQGQDYWGSIFWDCDLYVLPFFTYTQPDYARRCLLYRYHTLDGARRKAASLGFQGAYYAWQSQETGDETCALYVFDNPLTGEKIRSYFADEQIHISADVVYALWQYVQATGDLDFLRDYGAEIACEVARFFVSRATYNSQLARYELLTVLGPDEYHERVDNNAYTNTLAAYSLDVALKALEQMRFSAAAAYARLLATIALTDAEIESWRVMKEQLYVPQPDDHTSLIEQFDGYFQLEDVPPDVARSRLAHPDLHPGGPLGPFQATQAIKQADVVLLLYLLRDRYRQAVKSANWDYYEPRTAHDSSLSPMAYALVAADLDRLAWAYRYFLHTAEMDLLGTGPHWNLGVHTAAMGGAWLVIVHGFCHLDLRETGVHLSAYPKLPDGWARLAFSFYWRGHRVHFETGGQHTNLRADDDVPLIYPGGQTLLRAGETVRLEHPLSTGSNDAPVVTNDAI